VRPQFVLQAEEFGFEVEVEAGDVGEEAFAAGGLVGSVQQVAEAGQRWPQVAVSFPVTPAGERRPSGR
jgi:hypothetical protein